MNWSARRPIILGCLALVLLVGGLGVWGTFAKISGAIIASGMIQVETFRQVVQHPTGGVVGEINVNEGDMVDAGDVLVRFDDTLLVTELTAIEDQYTELLAQKARLEAERDEQDEVTFDQTLLQAAQSSPDIVKLMTSQTRLFDTRRDAAAREIEQLNRRKEQVLAQIDGLNAQLTALSTQRELIASEQADQQALLDKGLAQASRVLSLQREAARLEGQVGELQAAIAQGRGQITTIEIEQIKLQTQAREVALEALRELQTREIQLTERMLSLRENLMRMDVRAPMSGIVYGKQVNTIRSVVRAADPIMYIVPQDSPLVVTSRIDAIHIDQVRVGQPASLRFSTFDQRTTPEIFATVTKVSADVFQDEQTGLSFYSAELLPNEGELDKLGELELLPGMPVEAFIKTDDRTPLGYLIKPFTDYFNRAFRES